MAKPAMTQFCWCCGDLRIGTMVIIIIQFILCVIGIGNAIAKLSNDDYKTDEHATSISEGSNDDFSVKDYYDTKNYLIIQITFMLLSFIFNGCAFYGALMRFHRYILPLVVFNGIIYTLHIIFAIFVSVVVGIFVNAYYAFVTFIVAVLTLGKSF